MPATTQTLATLLKDHRADVQRIVAEKPDWKDGAKRFDAFYAHLANAKDPLWSAATMKEFSTTYFAQREKDKGMSNIVTRTVPALPKNLQAGAKLIFLHMAEACTFFNAQHKVNFSADELPAINPIPMLPGKAKGTCVLAQPMPALYAKTSLTFDHWVPKLLEWMDEVRTKGLRTWRGKAILEHEACTDFMRIALLFLNDPTGEPPIAKAEEREKLLALFGQPFVWIKKSVKREDIAANSLAIRSGLEKLGKDIPLEAWGRVLRAPFMKVALA
jgi:hypothetical protein